MNTFDYVEELWSLFTANEELKDLLGIDDDEDYAIKIRTEDVMAEGYEVDKLQFITIYFSEGEFTGEDIEKEFFGCGGVAKIDNLQKKLIKLARGGFKHHTTVANGHVKKILEEAFKYYLGYDVVSIEV